MSLSEMCSPKCWSKIRLGKKDGQKERRNQGCWMAMSISSLGLLQHCPVSKNVLPVFPAHLNTPTASVRPASCGSFWNNDVFFTSSLPLSFTCYPVPTFNYHCLYLSRSRIPAGLHGKPPIVLMVSCVQTFVWSGG